MNHSYIDSLIQKCEKAKIALPAREIIITSLDKLESRKIGNCIYIIELINGDAIKVHKDFKQYKLKKERACSKLNEPSETLYVGSSTTGVKGRLKQHLDEGPKNTYSLHMRHWFKGKCQVKILEYNVDREVLQIIEDSISYNLKPAFGKRGGNNR